MGKKAGVQADDVEVVDQEPEEDVDEFKKPTDQEDQPDESVETGEEDIEQEGEDGEVGEPAEDDEVPAVDEEKAVLKAKLAELEAKVNAPKQPEYREPTPEEQAEFPEKYGMEYRAFKTMNSQLATLGQSMKQYIDNLFSQLSVGNSLKDFSSQKGFEDAGKYGSDMQKFLNEKVDPSRRSDKEMLEMAYFYAKGRAMSGNVKKVIDSKERNRKIGTTNRPSSPSARVDKRPSGSVKLDATQRSAMRASGMSEDEYIKYARKSA